MNNRKHATALYDVFESPIGKLTVVTDKSAIIALHVEGDRYFTNIPKQWESDPSNPLLQQAHREIDEYFAGARKRFDVPLNAQGTDFQKAVWDALQNIPFGSTVSYGELADKIGKPRAARAVGTAAGRNPICLIVPCHRVLTNTAQLGGYVAGIKFKQYLLAFESK